MTAACRCGARVYASQSEAIKAEPNGSFKCPTCHTFARDHECRCDQDSDFRCWDCDTRHGSHGNPPKDGLEPAWKAYHRSVDRYESDLRHDPCAQQVH